MLRLVFITHGSTGDTVPVIRVAEAAVNKGHKATLLVSPFWRSAAEERGIKVIPIPPSGDQSTQAEFMRQFSHIRNKRVLLERMFAQVNSWQNEILPLLERETVGADALFCSYLFPIYRNIADQNQIPTISLHFCPNTYLSRSHPPEDLPKLPSWTPKTLQYLWNEALTSLGERYLTPKLNRHISNPAQKMRNWLRGNTTYQLVLAPLSMHRGAPSNLPNTSFFSGFVGGGFSAENSQLPTEIVRSKPLLTFGSVTTEKMREQFLSLYRHWPKAKPLVIQEGWFKPPTPPADSKIQMIAPGAHGDLFRAASAIIHHGGAGTTTSALLAGTPQVVIPHFADQDFWANTIKRLGCGQPLSRKVWPEKLSSTLDRISASPEIAEASSSFANRQMPVNGAENAVAQVEAWLKK